MTNIIMKLHLLFATAALAVASSVVVSADTECPDNQIPCDISSDADCRRRRDRTSRACGTTWSKGCCVRNCWPDPKKSRGRICKIAPPSEDFFGIYGFADIEDYAGDEDSEDFDSEDFATEISADSEDEDSESEDAAFEDSEDMIFYTGFCSYRGSFNGRRIRTLQDLTDCCKSEFHDCKWEKSQGYFVPNCARQRQQCGRQDGSEDVFGIYRLADIEDYAGDEDSEDFDSEDFATEISADSEDEDSESEDAAIEDSEDMIFYTGFCSYRGSFNGRRIRTLQDLTDCCKSEFHDCKWEKSQGYFAPNCARQRQQCGRQDGSEDVFGIYRLADIEDYAGDEDSEDFDSEDFATEISADSEDEDSESEDAAIEDSEDMIFYTGFCSYRGSLQDLTDCCHDEFLDCKDDKRRGFSVPNCARQRQQCGRQDRLVQVA